MTSGGPTTKGILCGASSRETPGTPENFAPDRWPAGNPETGYLDCDGSPTKTAILEAHRARPEDIYWARCFGKRPREEFYNLKEDPDCLHNLAQAAQATSLQSELREQLLGELRAQSDPRVLGEGAMFDAYPHANKAESRLLRTVYGGREDGDEVDQSERF